MFDTVLVDCGIEVICLMVEDREEEVLEVVEVGLVVEEVEEITEAEVTAAIERFWEEVEEVVDDEVLTIVIDPIVPEYTTFLPEITWLTDKMEIKETIKEDEKYIISWTI